MLDYVNSIACAFLLACMLPAASLVSPARHPWHVALMLFVEFALFLQIVGPWVGWLETAAWHTSLLHGLQAVGVVVWRRRIWLFVRAEFDDGQHPHPMRRIEDMFALEVEVLERIHGRGE